MNNEQFEHIVQSRLQKCKELLCNKNIEYSRNNDRFHNFKIAARYDNESPERSLWGMLKKHLVSIHDIINDIEYVGKSNITHEEKISDTINYLLLLDALIIERKQGGDT